MPPLPSLLLPVFISALIRIQVTTSWIIPQPKQNIWVTLVKSLKQDNLCMAMESVDDPLLTCLVGVSLSPNDCPYSTTDLGSQVAIKRVSRERISEWGALVPPEPALLWKVWQPGFRGIVQFLDWFEVPEGFTLLMERPQRCQHLWYFLHERQFLMEPVARGLFRQVLEAVRCCSSRGVLHRHIKAENILVDLATGEVKLINFGCGTILQDTFYTRMSGTPEYSPPEWILFGCYHGQPATIWSLGILLYELVCEHLPFHTNKDIVWSQLFFLRFLSAECQHFIRWCLCMDPTDRPSLEDLFEHSWLQEPCLAQETAEMHPVHSRIQEPASSTSTRLVALEENPGAFPCERSMEERAQPRRCFRWSP
ncbi:LOW QUALITY PROTEIN: serine/threonine-protein kinase pim-1-like [Melospiza melodia melodia]|uniref:LOW QUALITY PROTEIN: serine/threonine-protein kinase pim-1-like n=1 Tax=Melospiza melodia melodia TaxID=1914991 RepID=UPI002FD508AF